MCLHGYPPTKKGYKLLNLLTTQMFIFRDVTFHESVFPLNTKTDKIYMQPNPDPKPTHTQPTYDDDQWITNDELESTTPSPTPTH